jgi:hypothetical protein
MKPQIIRENTRSNIDGTIIDLETIGEFAREYNDSRRYSQLKPVFFGYMTKAGLTIICTKRESQIEQLLSDIPEIMSSLLRPFYSFNTEFEMGVLFHSLGRKTLFDRELQKERFEPKISAVRELKLDNYDDPFNDDGKKFPPNWKKGNMKDCIAHNRADLYKERDILLKRGFRKPEKLEFVES